MATANDAKRAVRGLVTAALDSQEDCLISHADDCHCGRTCDALLRAADALAEALGEVARREPYGVAARTLARVARMAGP